MSTATEFKFTVNDVQLQSQYEKTTALEILELAAEKGAISGKPENYTLQSLVGEDRHYHYEDPVDLSVDHRFIALPSGPTPVA